MMNYTNYWGLAVSSMIGLLVSACSGDDNEKSGSATSVPADKQLAALTDAEVTQLNNDMAAYAAQQVAGVDKGTMCRFAGVMMSATSAMMPASGETPTDASIQESCTSMETMCQQGSSTDTSEMAGETSQPPPLDQGALADCTATVAEYEACMKDTTSAAVKMMGSMPKCSELKAATIQTTLVAAMTPAGQSSSCQSLATTCPGYADADMDETATQ